MPHSTTIRGNAQPNQIIQKTGEDAIRDANEKNLWAMEQSDALAKMKIFSAMAKQMNSDS